MERKCHMEIPHYVFHKLEDRFGELRPLFLKFAHSHINFKEVTEIMDDVDKGISDGHLKPSQDQYKREVDVKNALDQVFRDVAGDKKLLEIRDVYLRTPNTYKKAFLKHVKQRYGEEIKNPEIQTSWKDLTSVYPDKFDGDNITLGYCHSCKFKDIQSLNDPIEWDTGNVCHSINALTWRICGLYKEFYKETDVLASEHSKVSVVQEFIKFSHYVLDSSTIVHLMNTSSHFHSNFETDLDNVVDDLLPQINININQGLINSFEKGAYGEADKRAKEAFKKFYFPILDLYGRNTKENDKAERAFSKGKSLDLAKDMIQNACQNLADFWEYILELIDEDLSWYEYIESIEKPILYK